MKCILTKLKFHKQLLKLQIDSSLADISLKLVFRGKLKEECVSHDFQMKKKDERHYEAVIDLSACKLMPVYYDLIAEGKENGKKVTCRVDAGKLRKIICFPFYDAKYLTKDGKFFYPYVMPDRSVAFQYREYASTDGVWFRIREALVLACYLVTKPYWNRKRVYLVYEKFCMMAQDNGFYFFKYCMEHQAEQTLGGKIYYVIDKNAPDMEKLEPYKDHVVYAMSMKHKLLLLVSRLLISTDSRKHAYVFRIRMSVIDHYLRKKKIVFLQHGVTAFKRISHIYGKNCPGSCSLFITTSDAEKQIIMRECGYADNEVAVTGFARWDALKDDRSDGDRKILILPTWRNWLEEVDDDILKTSSFYKSYYQILHSEKFAQMLEEHDLYVDFCMHPKFRNYLKDFSVPEGSRIRLVPFGEVPVNVMLMQCRLLVTDYSSVSWDVFYQGKPVIFYQPDLDKYMESQGSFVSMPEELFGPAVDDVADLTKEIAEYESRQFALREPDLKKREKAFKYIDRDNCKRILEEIQKRKW